MKIKKFQIKQVDGEGEVSAVLASLNVKDHDGDVTLPGAFGEQEAPIQPAHDWMNHPLGKATISEKDDEALVQMKFNDTTDAQDWYKALKFDFENGTPLQQYSYGYDILDSEPGEHEGDEVQLLKSLKVNEVSPVLLGAGINTRTLAVKSGLVGARTWKEHFETIEALGSEVLDFYNRAVAGSAARGKEGRTLSGANRDRLSRLLGTISEIQADIEKFLDDTDPSDDGKAAALYAQFIKTKTELGHLLRQ